MIIRVEWHEERRDNLSRAEQSRAEQSRAEQSRAEYIDVLRIIACLLVIFNHTNERGFYQYVSAELGSFEWWGKLYISTVCKSAVPIFFMISGSLLLRKEETILKTYKRITKILIDLILFSIAYFWTDLVLAGNCFSIKDTISKIIFGNYWHLWYLYAYITLIITLPFLRKMVKGLDVKSTLYLFLIAFITMGIVPIIEYCLGQGINGNLKPYWIASYIFIYPVIGYILDNKLDIKRIQRKHLVFLWVVNILCFSIGEISEYYFLQREPGSVNETFLTNFCLVNATAIFLTIKYLLHNICFNRYIYIIITEVGKCTYGIYLLHIWFLWKIPFFYEKWIQIEQSCMFGKLCGCIISCIYVFALAGLATWVLRKVPIIKKII